jgi:chemotaxis receptor (MCP) glutamine deamidase CheD
MQSALTDLQSVLAYLSHAALLLRQRAHNEVTSTADAKRFVESAATIQRLIDAIEHIGHQRSRSAALLAGEGGR